MRSLSFTQIIIIDIYHTYVYVYIYITHLFICLYIYMHTYTHTHTHTDIYIYIYTHTLDDYSQSIFSIEHVPNHRPAWLKFQATWDFSICSSAPSSRSKHAPKPSSASSAPWRHGAMPWRQRFSITGADVADQPGKSQWLWKMMENGSFIGDLHVKLVIFYHNNLSLPDGNKL